MEQIIDLLQEFVFNLMVLALPIIAGFVIALLKAWIEKVLADVEEARPKLADAIRQAVSLAVKAAEGLSLAGVINDKKSYALSIAQIWLDEEGLGEINLGILEAAVEAEVLKVFNSPEGFDNKGWETW